MDGMKKSTKMIAAATAGLIVAVDGVHLPHHPEPDWLKISRS